MIIQIVLLVLQKAPVVRNVSLALPLSVEPAVNVMTRTVIVVRARQQENVPAVKLDTNFLTVFVELVTQRSLCNSLQLSDMR